MIRTPNNTITIRIGHAKNEPWRTVIRSANRTAFGVAQEFFPDTAPGEHYENRTWRFMSTTWGWIYVSMRPTTQDDYLDPAVKNERR